MIRVGGQKLIHRVGSEEPGVFLHFRTVHMQSRLRAKGASWMQIASFLKQDVGLKGAVKAQFLRNSKRIRVTIEGLAQAPIRDSTV
jgi:hypothetical protein